MNALPRAGVYSLTLKTPTPPPPPHTLDTTLFLGNAFHCTTCATEPGNVATVRTRVLFAARHAPIRAAATSIVNPRPSVLSACATRALSWSILKANDASTSTSALRVSGRVWGGRGARYYVVIACGVCILSRRLVACFSAFLLATFFRYPRVQSNLYQHQRILRVLLHQWLPEVWCYPSRWTTR